MQVPTPRPMIPGQRGALPPTGNNIFSLLNRLSFERKVRDGSEVYFTRVWFYNHITFAAVLNPHTPTDMDRRRGFTLGMSFLPENSRKQRLIFKTFLPSDRFDLIESTLKGCVDFADETGHIIDEYIGLAQESDKRRRALDRTVISFLSRVKKQTQTSSVFIPMTDGLSYNFLSASARRLRVPAPVKERMAVSIIDRLWKRPPADPEIHQLKKTIRQLEEANPDAVIPPSDIIPQLQAVMRYTDRKGLLRKRIQIMQKRDMIQKSQWSEKKQLRFLLELHQEHMALMPLIRREIPAIEELMSKDRYYFQSLVDHPRTAGEGLGWLGGVHSVRYYARLLGKKNNARRKLRRKLQAEKDEFNAERLKIRLQIVLLEYQRANEFLDAARQYERWQETKKDAKDDSDKNAERSAQRSMESLKDKLKSSNRRYKDKIDDLRDRIKDMDKKGKIHVSREDEDGGDFGGGGSEGEW